MSKRRAARRIAVGTILGAALWAAAALAEPTPGFDASTSTPTVGQEVTFTALDACALPVTCSWDFGDNSPTETGQVVRHAYAAAGLVTVTLTTDDPGDSADPVTTGKDLLVAPVVVPNRAPKAVAGAFPTNPFTSQVVQFDASGSTDPDGDPLTYEWDLDGSGFKPLGEKPSHTYTEDGTVTVSLRATDPDGADSVAFFTITVRNQLPTVSIEATPKAPLSDEQVSFTAFADDRDGKIESYAWKVDGEAFGTTQDATTSFAIAGTHEVRVTVTDDDGGTGQATLRVTIGNRAPTAAFSYAPDPVAKGQPVTFTAQASDPEGRLSRLRWDFNGDGTYDAEGTTVTRTFPVTQPEIDVELKVTDLDGGSAVATKVITPGNLSPTATLAASSTTPLTDELVTYTGTASDPDGQVTYAWDLDADGDYDDAAGSTAARTFAVPGKAVVRLRVTDNDGASLTVEQEVVVQARPAVTQSETLGNPIGPQAPVFAPVPVPLPALGRPRLLTPFPVVRFAGALSAGGARLTLFTIKAPRGARIAASCHGAGCPVIRRTRAAGLERLRALQRAFRAGVRIEVRVTKPERIGKYVRITIRKGRAPARRDACLWPGSRSPRACP